MGVRIALRERPMISSTKVAGRDVQEAGSLVFKDGRTETFDLIVPCTGATPNCSVLSPFLLESISSETGFVKVEPTLQISGSVNPNIFALGDVAETRGPKMARAAMAQADLVSINIVALIKGDKLKDYVPHAIEGFLTLSLGLEENVMYVRDGKGGDIMVPGKSKNIDLDVRQAWWYLNASMESECIE